MTTLNPIPITTKIVKEHGSSGEGDEGHVFENLTHMVYSVDGIAGRDAQKAVGRLPG